MEDRQRRHTGIVTDVTAEKVTITHAKGKKWGTITGDIKFLSYFTNMTGWVGFFRPKNDIPEVQEKDIKGLKSRLGFYETLLNAYQKVQKMNNILKDVDSKKSVQNMINDVQNMIDDLKEEIGDEAMPDKNTNNDDK